MHFQSLSFTLIDSFTGSRFDLGHDKHTLFVSSVVCLLTNRLQTLHNNRCGDELVWAGLPHLDQPNNTGPAYSYAHWLLGEAHRPFSPSHWLELTPLLPLPRPFFRGDVGQVPPAGSAGNRSNNEVRQVYHEKRRSGQCAQTY